MSELSILEESEKASRIVPLPGDSMATRWKRIFKGTGMPEKQYKARCASIDRAFKNE